jgi:hypothetical protein
MLECLAYCRGRAQYPFNHQSFGWPEWFKLRLTFRLTRPSRNGKRITAGIFSAPFQHHIFGKLPTAPGRFGSMHSLNEPTL